MERLCQGENESDVFYFHLFQVYPLKILKGCPGNCDKLHFFVCLRSWVSCFRAFLLFYATRTWAMRKRIGIWNYVKKINIWNTLCFFMVNIFLFFSKIQDMMRFLRHYPNLDPLHHSHRLRQKLWCQPPESWKKNQFCHDDFMLLMSLIFFRASGKILWSLSDVFSVWFLPLQYVFQMFFFSYFALSLEDLPHNVGHFFVPQFKYGSCEPAVNNRVNGTTVLVEKERTTWPFWVTDDLVGSHKCAYFWYPPWN